MLFQISRQRMILHFFRQEYLLSFKLLNGINVFIRFIKRFYQHTVIITNGNQSSIKSPVQVGTKGKSVANGIIAGLGKGNNVAGIDHLHFLICNDAHAGDAAGIVVNFRYLFFKDTAANEYFFFVKRSSFGFIGGRCFVQDLVNDGGNQFIAGRQILCPRKVSGQKRLPEYCSGVRVIKRLYRYSLREA